MTKKIVNLQEYELKLKKEIEIEKEYKQLPNLKSQSAILKEENLRKVCDIIIQMLFVCVCLNLLKYIFLN